VQPLVTSTPGPNVAVPIRFLLRHFQDSRIS
jgi:hypothetical protein